MTFIASFSLPADPTKPIWLVDDQEVVWLRSTDDASTWELSIHNFMGMKRFAAEGNVVDTTLWMMAEGL